jgi:uncharacterized protein (DUF952 family)
MNDPVAYHLIPAASWEAADPTRPLHVGSLETDGFVHLTHRMTDLVDVANSLYRDDPGPRLVLTVRLASLTSPWRIDGDERFPHVYGPLDREAITEVRAISRLADGTFLPIERPDPRTPPDVPGLLRALVDACVAFVVVGSGGAGLLGADLDPGDLDVCVATDRANLDRLGQFLLGIHARPRVWVPGWVTEEEAAAWRPSGTRESLELLFESDLGDVDVLFGLLAADGGTERAYTDLLGSSRSVEVDGVRVAVASPEDLVASKLASRRPKDLRARTELERLLARAEA